MEGIIIGSVSQVRLVVSELESFRVNVNELILGEDGLDAARVLLGIAKEDSFSQFEELLCWLLQQLHFEPGILVTLDCPQSEGAHI